MAGLLDAGLLIGDVGRLTAWQIRHLYGHARDRHGQIKYTPSGDELTYEQQFRALWHRRGLPAYRVEAKWREYLKRAAAEEKRHGG